jgi:phosphatidylglycerol:prolipoprotein diacylglycerol transferase
MLQVLFRVHLFGHVIPIYGYGLMLVIAFLACVKTSRWLAVRKDMNPDHFVDAALIALATGIIGARLCHVLENIHEYTRADLTVAQNLFNIVNTREGGLTFYGGFLLATPCCIAYGLWRKAPILLGMDIVAPVVMIGLGIGRIGCFLNGCCYGAPCDLPWAVRFPYATNLPVHPTQLYSSFTAFLLAVLLIVYLGLPHLDGRVFALMLMLEGLARYLLELIRVEPAVFTLRLHGQSYAFSISMILALAAIVAGFIFWKLLGHRLAGSRNCG